MGRFKIDIADIVKHNPTGEEWVVARVFGEHLWPAGWPPGRAELADCELVEKATEEQREIMIRRLQKLPNNDERKI
jgi:hypothetical protein